MDLFNPLPLSFPSHFPSETVNTFSMNDKFQSDQTSKKDGCQNYKTTKHGLNSKMKTGYPIHFSRPSRKVMFNTLLIKLKINNETNFTTNCVHNSCIRHLVYSY